MGVFLYRFPYLVLPDTYVSNFVTYEPTHWRASRTISQEELEADEEVPQKEVMQFHLQMDHQQSCNSSPMISPFFDRLCLHSKQNTIDIQQIWQYMGQMQDWHISEGHFHDLSYTPPDPSTQSISPFPQALSTMFLLKLEGGVFFSSFRALEIRLHSN